MGLLLVHSLSLQLLKDHVSFFFVGNSISFVLKATLLDCLQLGLMNFHLPIEIRVPSAYISCERFESMFLSTHFGASILI